MSKEMRRHVEEHVPLSDTDRAAICQEMGKRSIKEPLGPGELLGSTGGTGERKRSLHRGKQCSAGPNGDLYASESPNAREGAPFSARRCHVELR